MDSFLKNLNYEPAFRNNIEVMSLWKIYLKTVYSLTLDLDKMCTEAFKNLKCCSIHQQFSILPLTIVKKLLFFVGMG